MIEVSASLPRGPVFLAGETIQCEIYFTNIGSRSENEPDVSSLAWASVQIICQCTVSESRILLPRAQNLSTEDASTTGCDTSFVPTKGERGLTVLSTKPKILFCDLRLQRGESKSFTFQDAIPTDAPPSFRGQAVKYSYKVIIGTQRLENVTKMLRIPFRVMVLYGLNDISVYNESEEYAPSNPFLNNQQKENSVLDIALQVLSTVTARKAPHSYNITNARGRVAKFLLFKQAYKLGEDIVGIFDFSDGTVPCVQYSVTLQSEEQIAEECRRKPSQGTAITSYVKHQEMCLHTLRTNITIPLPLTASPGFITDIVCLRWRLHFEFVTSCDPVEEVEMAKTDDGSTWRGPPTMNVETMVWDMPIKVFPTNPLHASSVTLMKTGSTIRV
ncbi:RAB6A-GEF complex partner protein 2-like [Haliotis rufescens]|uniref:RAB6A-GEF complex partner protein 2-like n=1 Tax=Haliotis rufescens TaxID=6454 RepID=UPI001EB02D36|nr:RAB6A-GEF complex partner protein 2-like [Haliotis rufescens]XP_046354864.1 RAB6A-GEF complex partner protein 2-like [Haliotis rufescens]